ncbi:MAG: GAF domain-containing protein [Prevotellaceae bacterium]|jgi:GAF domain-containing protein|nr:GAF domain-containing protein [Prevotellaceae bacterium]
MIEQFSIAGSTKETKYQSLLKALASLLKDEPDLIANMANVSAAIKEVFGFLWVGFYLVRGEELVLGPFQGSIACSRIKKGKGVCGASWKNEKSIIVPDVSQFLGHIACSSLSESEIVIPIFKNNNITGVLDIDSEHLNHFDETDEKYLSQIVEML